MDALDSAGDCGDAREHGDCVGVYESLSAVCCHAQTEGSGSITRSVPLYSLPIYSDIIDARRVEIRVESEFDGSLAGGWCIGNGHSSTVSQAREQSARSRRHLLCSVSHFRHLSDLRDLSNRCISLQLSRRLASHYSPVYLLGRLLSGKYPLPWLRIELISLSRENDRTDPSRSTVVFLCVKSGASS